MSECDRGSDSDQIFGFGVEIERKKHANTHTNRTCHWALGETGKPTENEEP